MKLAVFLAYHSAVEVAVGAERLGVDFALVPEGFRSDAVSVLGAVAARTSAIALAPGVMQIPARTPVLTALTAAGLDALSGGRFRLALGLSNPDVSLGWYGVPFDRPLGRIREYVDVVRLALSGEPVRYRGKHFRLPPDESAEPAWLHAAPVRGDLPIYLAAVGPRNLELTGEIADGWIGVFNSPDGIAEALTHVAAGRARAGKSMAGFEVLPSVPIAVDEDPRVAARSLRPYFANFIGLGSKERSVYFALAVRLGYAAAAERIHEAIRAGDRAAAAAAVPFELIDRLSLLGDERRIRARMAEYARAGVTTLGLTLLAPTAAAQLAAVRVAVAAVAPAAEPVSR
ncbi:LLM class flavin-dependent oxidoreductase [Amycolatopsis balhimycina DSM 5908]|uniref:LLM class flavin-dependent oxidoreductase n=1 Tax=Amycolatopsis balhimycina DSM 5908 TaxID=1081091 RepID=A0A428WP92_AMYBA|nr:LLM class flavin-dependent oxidoreductase [Amycolatopsis balhimycina]RSM44874.1 LLM class flavin-dependent oxidoreductase [Amycolatopsis balhimycina DSM 5908]